MLPVAPRANSRMVAGGFSDESFPSAKARRILAERFNTRSSSIIIIVRHDDWNAYSQRFSQSLLRLTAPIQDHHAVREIRMPITDPSFVSKDGSSAIVEIGLILTIEDSLPVIDEIIALIQPGPFDITVTGAPLLYRDIVITSGNDLKRSEIVAFPLATIALLIVFGTLVAAAMPVAVGGAAVVVGLGIVFYLATARDMSILSFNIITLLGIGMGIDYSLFYVSRFREELAIGRSVEAALKTTQSRAGLPILFSGATSVIGLLGLLLFDLPVLESVGIGAVVVISLALLAALTLMPALLAVVGFRINRYRFVPRLRLPGNIWVATASWVMRHPIVAILPTGLLLLALAVPLKDLKLGSVDAEVLPKSVESRRGFDILKEQFGWEVGTELIVIYTFDGDPFESHNLTKLYAFGKALENLENVDDVGSFVNIRATFGLDDYRELYRYPEAIYDVGILDLLNETLRTGTVLFFVKSELHPFSSDASRLVSEIRAFDPGPGAEIYVDGSAASAKDLIESLYQKFPIVAGLIIFLSLLSLLVLFRSILIPLKAVILNIMSILASFGALVWVFQEGHFSWALRFDPMGVTEATMPIVLFAVLFGISMDYEIFLLSRIREAYQESGDNINSVRMGLQRSSAIIIGAASILIIVGASFVFADLVTVKAVGFSLALAILIDVTIVRILIAPALMRLFGDWNWWFPHWRGGK